MREIRFILSIALLACRSIHGFNIPRQTSSPRVGFKNSGRHNFAPNPATSSKLFSSPEDGLTPRRNPGKKIIQAIRRAFARFLSYPKNVSSKFSNLPRKVKRIVIIQIMVLTMLLGSIGRKVYIKYQQNGPSSTGPPIELAYSSFLDIVEQSGSKGSKSVVVDNVRISPDRIFYRITKEGTGKASGSESLFAYTRKVPASSELIQHLRSNDILFTAAPMKRANTFAVVARTAILGFYMLILWRMYKTFSGNSGAGDVPGKLASPASSLPLASFNDIQGIDNAKMEVMELVDTLRNPSKYEILGARAPTGLLLEGKFYSKT